jgi:hypothetical protein
MKTVFAKFCGTVLLSCFVLLPAECRPQQAGSTDAGNGRPRQLRFTVAHAHTATWCVGYLYISKDRVRYEVVQPAIDQQHSFDLARTDITTMRQWVLIGTPENAVEIKTARATYHFWRLPNDADLRGTPVTQWGMGSAVPAAPVLTALQQPEAEIDRAAAKEAAAAAADQNAASAGARAHPPANPPTDHAATDTSPNNAPVARAAAANPGAGPSTQSSQGGAKVYFKQYYHIGETSSVFSGTRKAFLVFFPSGWVSDQFPDQGLDGFDLVAFMRNPANAASVGKYRMTDTKAEIVLQDSGQTRVSVDFNNAAEDAPFFEDVYIPLCRCDGVRFSGLYDAGHHDPIQFSADGTFADGGALNTVVNTDGEHRWPGGQGTYSLRNYTLMLTYRDGRQIRKSFMAAAVHEKDQRFTWIGIGGYTFVPSKTQ